MTQFVLYRLIARSSTCGGFFERYAALLLVLALTAPLSAAAQSAPTQKEIAEGYLPYHRLVIEDFPVSDADHSPQGMYTYGLIRYRYQAVTVQKDNGFSARVTQWIVRCGFDRNRSWRKSWFKSFDEILPHEQGHLDITMLYGRRLARINLDKLPTGEGKTDKAAVEDLKKKLEALAERTRKELQSEQDAYDEATSHGTNRSKQREWTITLQDRLKESRIGQ